MKESYNAMVLQEFTKHEANGSFKSRHKVAYGSLIISSQEKKLYADVCCNYFSSSIETV